MLSNLFPRAIQQRVDSDSKIHKEVLGFVSVKHACTLALASSGAKKGWKGNPSCFSSCSAHCQPAHVCTHTSVSIGRRYIATKWNDLRLNGSCGWRVINWSFLPSSPKHQKHKQSHYHYSHSGSAVISVVWTTFGDQISRPDRGQQRVWHIWTLQLSSSKCFDI